MAAPSDVSRERTQPAFLKGAAAVFLCRVTGAVLTLVTQVILARWMGAEQMGIYLYAFSITLLVTTLSGIGLPAAAIRYIGAALASGRNDLIKGFIKAANRIYAALGLFLAVIGLVAINFIDGLVDDSRQATIAIALLMVPVLGQMISRTGVSIALSWFSTAFLPNLVFRPLLFLVFIAGAWQLAIPLTAEDAILLQFLAVAVVVLLLGFAVGRRSKTELGGVQPAYETREWVETAAPLLLVTLFTAYFLEMNLFIAGTILNDGDIAIFNAGFRIAALIAFGIHAVDSIALPHMSKDHAAGDARSLRANIRRACRLRVVGALLIAVPLLAAGKYVLLLFGPEFVAGYPALVILLFAQLINAALGPAARLLSVTGHQRHCLWVFFWSLLLLLVLHAVLTSRFGLYGAAVTVAITMVIQSAWFYLLASQHLGVSTLAFGNGRQDG